MAQTITNLDRTTGGDPVQMDVSNNGISVTIPPPNEGVGAQQFKDAMKGLSGILKGTGDFQSTVGEDGSVRMSISTNGREDPAMASLVARMLADNGIIDSQVAKDYQSQLFAPEAQEARGQTQTQTPIAKASDQLASIKDQLKGLFTGESQHFGDGVLVSSKSQSQAQEAGPAGPYLT